MGPGKGSAEGAGQSGLENAPLVRRDWRVMRKTAQAGYLRIDLAYRANRTTQLPTSLCRGVVYGDSVGRVSAGQSRRSCAAKTRGEIREVHVLLRSGELSRATFTRFTLAIHRRPHN